jgi:WD40 repeat protein
MPLWLKITGIALLAFSIWLVACSPPAAGEITESPTEHLPSASPIPPTGTPFLLDTPPIPTVSQKRPALKYNSWEIVHDLAYSSDGRLLAVSAGRHIRLYDVATLVEQFDLPIGAWAIRLAFHPFLPLVVLAVRDGTIQFWDTSTGTQRCQFTAHKKGANSLAIQPNGSLLATTGTDITSRLWDISSVAVGGCDVTESGRLIGESFSAPDAAFNVDGKMLALVDLTNIRLRDSNDLKLIATLPGAQPIFDIAFSPDDHWLAAAEHHDTVTLWDLAQPASPHPILLQPLDLNPKIYVWRVAFSPDSHLLAAGASDGTLTLWDISTMQPVETLHLSRAVSALSFSPDGKFLAAGGLDSAVWLFPVVINDPDPH